MLKSKQAIEMLANEGTFLPREFEDFEVCADLDGTFARKFLESHGFEVVENKDMIRNGVAITACGIRLSTNGYLSRTA